MSPSDERTSPEFHPHSDAEAGAFSISRIFEVPREFLFAAWTQEQHLKHWFCPSGFTIPVCKLNLVPGGVFHYCMRAPNGVEMWGKWIFQQIVPPEHLVFVNTFSNKHGNLTRHPYVPEWPLEILTTSTFADQEHKTRLTMVSEPVDATAVQQKAFDSMHAAMTQGWNGTFDQLAAYLATLNESGEPETGV
jgi:uncharacterized protein YndB with AHSA1/START domain